jgi:predicted PurR-regulated permease PerM
MRMVDSILQVAILPRPPAAAERARSISIPIIATGAAVALLYYGRVFFITAMASVVLAFILEPFVAAAMRFRLPRSVASFVVCTIALLLLYLMALGAYTQFASLIEDLPRYGQRIAEIVGAVQARIEATEQRLAQLIPGRQRKKEEEPPPPEPEPAKKSRKKRTEAPAAPPLPPPITEVRIREEDQTLIADYVFARLGSFYQVALMASFVPFLVYFMLSWRDHIHRSFLQFFHGEDRVVASKSLQGIADMVRAFVVGNFVLGFLLAVASAVGFWLVGLPYPLLIGPLSGILSLVPYIGLPLALIPPLFVGLAAYTNLSGYLLVTVVVSVLHLLALNLLYPKVVGSRVHLNPLVVTFALMLWGYLWDAAGLLLAIPMTAAIKAVCDNVRGLRPYGKFLGD